MKFFTLVLCLLTCFLITASPLLARELNVAFPLNVNGFVYALATQADGKTLVGGAFTQINGSFRHNVARLNADGSIDETFLFQGADGVDGTVYALAVAADGKIVVGGDFTQANGQNHPYLVRYSATGELDTNFPTQSGPAGIVYAVQTLPNGDIVVGGNFNMAAGAYASNLVIYHADGSVAVPGTMLQLEGIVYAIGVQKDGKIVIGGEFNQVSGRARKNIARLQSDGTLDDSFLDFSGAGLYGVVYALAIAPDGSVIAGGNFNRADNQVCSFLAKYSANGALDASLFNRSAPTGIVYAVQVLPTGGVVVGGQFAIASAGTSALNLAIYHADGSLDAGSMGLSIEGMIQAIAVVPTTGSIVAGGTFQIPGTEFRNCLFLKK